MASGTSTEFGRSPAVSATGSTLYELCASQTPSVIYILADNQISGAREFERQGVMRCVGDIREMGADRLAISLLDEAVKLAENYGERKRIALAQRALADGNGAKRIIKELRDSYENPDCGRR